MPRRLSRLASGLLAALAPVFAGADEASLRASLASPAALPRIESRDDGERVAGELHGVLAYPFEAAAAALKDPSNWCAILLLHLDTKECRVVQGPSRTNVQAAVVTHYDQPASTAYRVEFAYRLAHDSPGYLEARLDADDGPLDTRDFRIVFEAMPTADGRTFAHMAYAYRYGGWSRFALDLYLLTFGHGKVGFTTVGLDEQGRPRHVGGMRGVVERNTMRYFLAVDAWLGAMSVPREQRTEKALRNWYAAVERYPRQLHELSEQRYLQLKHQSREPQ